jgi:peptidoglycan/xylan/chitin deacetylase (PgdA/CDA1 family)
MAEPGTSAESGVRHRTLTHQELCLLDAHDLCDVGAHTITHPWLSGLPRERQRSEIRDGKAQLEEILGRDVALFAYPFDEPSAFDDDSVAIVREAGFSAAFRGERGTLARGGDRYRIPRCNVRDWDGAKFGRRVARWGRR